MAESVECFACDGNGTIEVNRQTASCTWKMMTIACRRCRGLGTVELSTAGAEVIYVTSCPDCRWCDEDGEVCRHPDFGDGRSMSWEESKAIPDWCSLRRVPTVVRVGAR